MSGSARCFGGVRRDRAPSTPAAPPAGRAATTLSPALLPAAVAASLAIVAIALRWRGSDLPAHFFRVAIVERDGFGVWNNLWYGGHHTLGYGALFPLLGSALGIWTVAIASAGASAFLADVLIRHGTGRRCASASMWFAVGTVTNVAIGRLPFALGMAIALGALVAMQRRRMVVTATLTLATAAASPVVSAFLALILLAWAWSSNGRLRVQLLALSVTSIAPVLLIAVVYPQGGTFPFRWPALVLTLLVSAAILVLVPPRYLVVRRSTALYTWRRAPGVRGADTAGRQPDPPRNVRRRSGPARPGAAERGRAGARATAAVLAVVASRRCHHPRGTTRPPSATTTVRWSRISPRSAPRRTPGGRPDGSALGSRVRRLPLPDRQRMGASTRHPLQPTLLRARSVGRGVPHVAARLGHRSRRRAGRSALDDSAVEEAALIDRGLPYLRPVWSDDNWRVYEVIDGRGLVDGPAEVVAMDIDSITLDVTAPGDVVVRVRESPFWVTDPPVCVEPAEDGWIVLRGRPCRAHRGRTGRIGPARRPSTATSAPVCDSGHLTRNMTFP